jgi:hypothetical protein
MNAEHNPINTSIDLEWVRITPDKVVVATADRAWVYCLSSAESSDFLAQPTSSAGNQAKKKLLDTSIVFAKRAVSMCPPLL